MIEKEINLNGKVGKVHEWKYQNTDGNDTGYNDLNKNELAKYNSQYWSVLNDQQKNDLIEEIFSIYRKRNIFPIYYYQHSDIIEEIQYIKEYCKTKLPIFNGEILDKRPNSGTLLLRYLFPNLQLIQCKNDKDNYMYERFFNDHKLKRAIRYCLDFKSKVQTPVTSPNLFAAMQLIGGNTGTNWLPLRTTMLLNYFLPEGGVYYDMSCGFGSRLLGSMMCEQPITYIGTDPSIEMCYHLNELKGYIKESFDLDDNRIQIYNQGSEVELPIEDNYVDFAFSSPCYFNLEKYCEEDTQCYNKYPNINLWLDGYVVKTIQNLRRILKQNAFYAVNIADFKIGNEDVHFVDEWIKISQENGFEFVKEIKLKVGKSRPNNLSERHAYIPKEEGIFLFKKK